MLAGLYKAMGRVGDATRVLEEALRMNKYNSEARAELVRLYSDQARWTQVEGLLKEAQEDAQLGDEYIWWYYDARMWVLRNNPVLELISIRKARMRQRDIPDVEFQYLKALLKNGEYSQVASESEPMIKVFPTDQRPWWLCTARGAALNMLGQKAEADQLMVAAMSDINRQPPEQADKSAMEFAQLCASYMGVNWAAEHFGAQRSDNMRWTILLTTIYLGEANSATTPQQRREAIQRAVEIADKLDKLAGEPAAGSPFVGGQRIWAMEQAALTYLTAATDEDRKRERDAAERIYLALLPQLEKANPETHLHTLNNLANLLAQGSLRAVGQEKEQAVRKALDYAAQAYKKMLAAEKILPAIADTYGWVLTLAGKTDEAIEVLSKATQWSDAPPDAFYHLASAYWQKKDATNAREKASQALKIFEGRRRARRNLSHDEGQMERRVKDLLEEIEKSPKPSDATGAAPEPAAANYAVRAGTSIGDSDL
jgi:Flp pilus assembly protein TadD